MEGLHAVRCLEQGLDAIWDGFLYRGLFVTAGGGAEDLNPESLSTHEVGRGDI